MKINRHSVLFKINVVFILIFVILLFFYFSAYRIINRIETFHFIKKVIFLAKKNKLTDENFLEISLIKNRKDILKILKGGKYLLKRNPPRVSYILSLLIYKGNEYIYLKSKIGKSDFLLERRPKAYGRLEILTAAWLGLDFVLILLYLSIYRSINPLGKLRNKIEEFKNGNIDVNLDGYIDRKDEIGYVAKELKGAIDNVKKTINTRTWFIRNIAHELKTPITKGKIALELLKDEDENRKKVFADIFIRLETLINELFSSEKIAAGNKEINLTSFNFQDAINRAKELLLVKQDENIEIMLDVEYAVKADFDLLSIAVKNLIENGIKFSDNKKVTVEIKNGILSFTNTGNKPYIPEEAIFEPFLKDTNIKNKDGFGLGLYITKQILEKHGLKIKYEYLKGENVFSIDLHKIIYVKTL